MKERHGEEVGADGPSTRVGLKGMPAHCPALAANELQPAPWPQPPDETVAQYKHTSNCYTFAFNHRTTVVCCDCSH